MSAFIVLLCESKKALRISGLPSQEINVLYLTLGGVVSSIEEYKVSNERWIQETGKEYEGGVNMLTPDSR